MEEIAQTQMYTSGAYREQVLEAVSRRDDIEAVLAQHRTKKVSADKDASAQEAADLADSVANEDDEEGDPTASASADAIARFPYRPYCRQCGRDTVTTTAYDDATTTLTYTCSSCGFEGTTDLSTDTDGKLVWKVDWPMRWAYESVNFEPAGRDHMTPGSSYTVGTEIVSSIFDWRAPARVIYAFVGFAGVQKMSSSAGGVPTASDALRILEAPMLRWLYVRRAPTQAFDIDFGASVVRLYDEWDALGRKAADPAKADVATLAWHRASSTASAGTLPTPAVPVPFRTLSSVADVTAGSAELISRIIESSGFPHDSVDDLEPRLSKAMQWTAEHVPADERTTVRETPDTERLASLSEDEELWLRIFLDRLPDDGDLDAVTAVVYGTPKVARGLGFDDAPTDQVKADQKDFFRLLYNLLVAADRGPRLPTLVLALGPAKVRTLLGG
jgi:lysyl-tRNA synthetase class 1